MVPPALHIRIPRDHPKAGALLALARRLATHQQRGEGVILTKIQTETDPEKQFVHALTEIGLDPEELAACLVAEKAALDKAAAGQAVQRALQDPLVLAGVIGQALSSAPDKVKDSMLAHLRRHGGLLTPG